MGKQKKKYYTVWIGRETGVFDDWEDAREQVEGFPGARYRSFNSAAEAAEAFRDGPDASPASLGSLVINARSHGKPQTDADRLLTLDEQKRRFPEIDPEAWAVDASCLGNPGTMEYQCIDLATGTRVFHFGPVQRSTNNIGEFLAIVHALSLMHQRGERHTVYSDSRTALAWLRKKTANTKLTPEKGNPKVSELLRRAEIWLRTHPTDIPVRKWQTEIWGEIPADFGRK